MWKLYLFSMAVLSLSLMSSVTLVIGGIDLEQPSEHYRSIKHTFPGINNYAKVWGQLETETLDPIATYSWTSNFEKSWWVNKVEVGAGEGWYATGIYYGYQYGKFKCLNWFTMYRQFIKVKIYHSTSSNTFSSTTTSYAY